MTSLLVAGGAPPIAQAENAMGYQLLSTEQAIALPHNHGSLGMDVERSQQITDGAMTFDIIRIKQVGRGSPGAQAGFKVGDQIIAVDSRVFPTLASFAGYIGALSPGTLATVDYIPVGGGPAQAQRVPVTIGAPGRSVQPVPNATRKRLRPVCPPGRRLRLVSVRWRCLAATNWAASPIGALRQRRQRPMDGRCKTRRPDNGLLAACRT